MDAIFSFQSNGTQLKHVFLNAASVQAILVAAVNFLNSQNLLSDPTLTYRFQIEPTTSS